MTAPAATAGGRGRTARWAILVLGVGLALAPVAFQMFTRAPGGGRMIDDFAPYMRTERIEAFQTDLATIDAAHRESTAIAAAAPSVAQASPAVVSFNEQWPSIDDDMGSMLATMADNIGNYRGVAALPPFALFPWFFVAPGLLIAGVAAWSLRVDGARASRGRATALAVLGVGVLMAPAIFQMFSRAPGGAEMISEFRPFMTPTKVTEIQGYFLTIGSAEGDLRLQVLPELASAGPDAALETTAIRTLNAEWARISGDMAPMIGTMADNVGRFDGISSLPPFWLFPWFFVAPGILVGVLVSVDRSGRRPGSIAATDPQPALEGA